MCWVSRLNRKQEVKSLTLSTHFTWSLSSLRSPATQNFRAGVDFIYFRSMYIARVHNRRMHSCNKTRNVIFRSHFWNDKGLYIASCEWGISENVFFLRLLNFVKGPFPIIFQFHTPVWLSPQSVVIYTMKKYLHFSSSFDSSLPWVLKIPDFLYF